MSKLPVYPTSLPTVPAALHSPNPTTITLQDLATRLAVEPAKLLPAIKAGYLKLVSATPPVVYEPPPAAMEWLAQAYRPLLLRPFLSIEHVAELESLTIPDTRRLAVVYDIPVQIDPVFGDVMTVAAFHAFHKALHHYREPSRFDRQAMLVALLQSADPDKWKHDLKPPPFSKRLEKEIRRIAQLSEPLRTEMALRLVEAYEDAMGIARAVGMDASMRRSMEKVEKMVAVPDAEDPSEDGSL